MHLKAGAVAQWLCLPSMYKALGSTSSTAKKKKKEKEKMHLTYLTYFMKFPFVPLNLDCTYMNFIHAILTIMFTLVNKASHHPNCFYSMCTLGKYQKVKT
jgi:hypothetical protein